MIGLCKEFVPHRQLKEIAFIMFPIEQNLSPWIRKDFWMVKMMVHSPAKLIKVKSMRDVVWTYDMIGELDVFPHNLAASSPLVVGDLVFTVLETEWMKDTLISRTDCTKFIAVIKKQANWFGKIIHLAKMFSWTMVDLLLMER